MWRQMVLRKIWIIKGTRYLKLQSSPPPLAKTVNNSVHAMDTMQLIIIIVLWPGGRIDHAHHQTRAKAALIETQQYSEAVGAAVDMTQPSDTLIIATADHSHVFTIGGYSPLDNDIMGMYW